MTVLKSYAKINLTLTVNKRLSTGLHNIQTTYCLINLADRISIKKIRNRSSDKLYFTGPFAKDVKKSKNSVQKILKILREHKLITNYFSVKVQKNVPVYAGLGGGTSNAASVLNYLCRKKINKKLLNKAIEISGSDMRLFLFNQGYMENLQTISPFKKKHKLYFLIVFPKIKSSTKEVYSKLKKYSAKKKFQRNRLKKKQFFINYISKTKNDLQSIVEKKHPLIRELLTNIRSYQGCFFSKMTGSGSACYGLFVNEHRSKVALHSLRKRYPKFWFSIAKTI